MENYKLKKKYSIIKKCYYDFYVDNIKVGSGWIRKRNSHVMKGIFLEIKPEFRRKKYGTKFYNLLCIETNSKVDYIIIKVKKNDKVANQFVSSLVNKYDPKFSIFNTNVYFDTLIEE